MRRTRPGLRRSERHVRLERPLAEVWSVLAARPDGDAPRWYADAAPLVLRARIDDLARAVLGDPPRPEVRRGEDAPGPPGLLSTGDTAGFWDVLAADHVAHRLRLQARVHAPGQVRLTTWLTPRETGCRLHLRITFRPSGLIGAAYLLTDLPARELVTEGVARRIVADVGR
ncbi:DUF2867 domain-containing protein [Nocardioides sp. CPCC 205120]|uniref:DUF2867 domain-containing protein n=1 Tax=Nocardioides sp. CPCC 205120 TaxID=3406462 RepID=UPI003B5106E3